ncbi:fructose-6-phosphate aldolase [Enterococcus ratti]|uniref:Fructose-6-phosphate aldolase n=2 Tax=Enterococcus ratti TaxID=150033 RepID=A0A1L8WGA3_9ENTE|nr:fructose-6-phosphate aldolase [Enterococcus ratti]
MLDTINLEAIRYYQTILPLTGITSNPSIVKLEHEISFFSHLKKIKQVIGSTSLHVQVVGETTKEMIEDAKTIVKKLGKETFIKIPVNEAGLAAIKQLKQEMYRITATAIYTEFQGYLAIAAGADYLAPYYNRMENLNIDAQKIIENLVKEISRSGSNSQIVAASFKNIAQINKACQSGVQAVTVTPDLIAQGFAMPAIQKAVTDFRNDWYSVFKVESIKKLAAINS